MRFVEEFCKSSDDGKRCRVPTELMQYLPDRYFVYENERYSRVLTLVDEDTIVYGSHDPNRKDEYFIVASKSQRRFLSVLYVNEEGMAVPVEVDQEKTEIFDIDGLGERWEGPILNNKPFGWGLRFDQEGELVYEGFSVLGKYSLFGTEYNAEGHTILYEGTWCDGRRCGRGRQYDRNGSMVYEGEWVNDNRMTDPIIHVPDSTSLLPPLVSLVVSIRIGDKCCGSGSSLVLNGYPRLRELVIGSESFGKESEEEMVFSCTNCPELVSISVGNRTMIPFKRMTISGERDYLK